MQDRRARLGCIDGLPCNLVARPRQVG